MRYHSRVKRDLCTRLSPEDGDEGRDFHGPALVLLYSSVSAEGLMLAGMKKPGIVVHSLRHSTLTFALLNDANPTRVQKMMRHQHYATTEIYVEEVQRLFKGAEDAVAQI
jgi:integrase